jgi:hypothetical protein
MGENSDPLIADFSNKTPLMEEDDQMEAATSDEDSTDNSKPATTMAINPLDETFYYYQNPTTGSVSSTPLSVRQLCRLFCPVRAGMTAILPLHTRCLAVEKEFGDWKVASEVDILKEASAQWYYTSNGKSEGHVSCRTLLEQPQSTLIYAKDITPEWTAISNLPNLQLVFEALSQAPIIVNQEGQLLSESKQPANLEADDKNDNVQDELEAFLSSTADTMGDKDDDDDDDDDHGYESDGGTKYVKDPISGNWIHEALAPPKPEPKRTPTLVKQPNKISKTNKSSNGQPKKAKFTKRNAKHWIYVTGLPQTGVSVSDLAKYFGKAGLLDLDPETLQPKIKLYMNTDGSTKGDASICYARLESVTLALQILDESPWDEHHVIKVERATFAAKKDEHGATDPKNNKRRRPVSEAKRKVARLALLQAQDEGFGERLSGGRKGLRIVVVKHMMQGIPENQLEDELQAYCVDHGPVEKITTIDKTKVVIIKFVEPIAASKALQAWHGSVNERTKQKLEAIYWDGVTDYTEGTHEAVEEEEKRHDEFGEWLETQEELPPEFQLQVAHK